MKKLPAIAMALLPFPALAGNYATCLLDKLPGVQNPQAVQAAERVCSSEYPGGFAGVAQGDGRGLFSGYESSDECLLEKSNGTQQVHAVRLIRRACARLYDEPSTDKPGTIYYVDEFGIQRKLVPYDGDYTPIQR